MQEDWLQWDFLPATGLKISGEQFIYPIRGINSFLNVKNLFLLIN